VPENTNSVADFAMFFHAGRQLNQGARFKDGKILNAAAQRRAGTNQRAEVLIASSTQYSAGVSMCL
jgi:hypothetical protein